MMATRFLRVPQFKSSWICRREDEGHGGDVGIVVVVGQIFDSHAKRVSNHKKQFEKKSAVVVVVAVPKAHQQTNEQATVQPTRPIQ
jgi:hypothetical protein